MENSLVSVEQLNGYKATDILYFIILRNIIYLFCPVRWSLKLYLLPIGQWFAPQTNCSRP